MGIADEFAGAFKSVTKDLHKEKKRRERDARRSHRAPSYSYRVTLKDAVFEVMQTAVANASGGGTYSYSARTLYYQVRPLIQEMTNQELSYSYFSQTLLTEYQEEHGALTGLYYEPRGELHEPHTDNSVALGTREVAAYEPPDWTFNKILYVEKQGLWPVLKEAKLAERYDMAIIAGNGFATEACRHLLADAGDEFRLFALHDCDPSGYNIARTLGEATKRMCNHEADVQDLGLTVADAIARGLPTEGFTRRRELPWPCLSRLDDQEREWFVGTPVGNRGQHSCTRVELNAFTGPDLIAYIEAGLDAHDATGKLIPPENVITERAEEHHRAAALKVLEERLHELVDLDAMVDNLVGETEDNVSVEVKDVEAALARDREIPWGKAVDDRVDGQLSGDLKELADQALKKALADGTAEA